MREFAYQRAEQVEEAIAAANAPQTKYLAGGTNLLDLMKGDVERPARIIDINRLPLAQILELPNGGVRLGAMVRNSDAANHRYIRQHYPLLSQALLAGASAQLRNMASVGGNLLQRTRCYYFYDTAFASCNKRDPGTGCAARNGFNRIHAVFGASEHCVATHPSDMAVALTALDAIVEVRGSNGTRRIPIGAFYRLPENIPEIDTTLAPGELIIAVELPPSRFSSHSHYVKVRDRSSYAFALVSVAAAIHQQSGKVVDARIVLGGVAHKPWRVKNAERQLVGGRLEGGTLEAAARASVEGAQPLQHNAFKIDLARRAVIQALQAAGASS